MTVTRLRAAVTVRDCQPVAASCGSSKRRHDYADGMSAERDELRELVEQLPDEEVPTVLADVRRHLQSAGQRSWPPAFFGAGRAGRRDVAARSEELLDEGFGRLA